MQAVADQDKTPEWVRRMLKVAEYLHRQTNKPTTTTTETKNKSKQPKHTNRIYSNTTTKTQTPMPNGYKKNLPARDLGRKRNCGSSSWVWCRCSSCTRQWSRMKCGIDVPEDYLKRVKNGQGGSRATLQFHRGYIRKSQKRTWERFNRTPMRKIKHVGLGKRVVVDTGAI